MSRSLRSGTIGTDGPSEDSRPTLPREQRRRRRRYHKKSSSQSSSHEEHQDAEMANDGMLREHPGASDSGVHYVHHPECRAEASGSTSGPAETHYDVRREQDAIAEEIPSSQRGGAPPRHIQHDLPPLSPAGGAEVGRTQEDQAPAPTERTDADAGPHETKKMPPIIVERLDDYPSHIAEIREALGRPPVVRAYGSGLKFWPEDRIEYDTVLNHLRQHEDSASWYTYSPPESKLIKIAIRGLPPCTGAQTVLDDLIDSGFDARYSRRIIARLGRPRAVFLVTLAPTPHIQDIWKISSLLGLSGIQIVPWRSRTGPNQCHRCQQFRHSSDHCGRPAACVKCGGPHPTENCTISAEEGATCVNCGGPHPASYRGCPIFKKEARFKSAGTIALTNIRRRPAPPVVREAQVEPPPASSPTLMAEANQARPRSRKPDKTPDERRASERERQKAKRKRKKQNKQKPSQQQQHHHQQLQPDVSTIAPGRVAVRVERREPSPVASTSRREHPLAGQVDMTLTVTATPEERDIIVTAAQNFCEDVIPVMLKVTEKINATDNEIWLVVMGMVTALSSSLSDAINQVRKIRSPGAPGPSQGQQ